MKNATLPPSKRSRIEHQMDRMIIFMFALLFAMCLIGAVQFAIWTKNLSPKMWYLAPDNAPTAFNPGKPLLAGVYSFVTSFVLYGYLIPISLYVSLEMVKVVQVNASFGPSVPIMQLPTPADIFPILLIKNHKCRLWCMKGHMYQSFDSRAGWHHAVFAGKSPCGGQKPIQQ